MRSETSLDEAQRAVDAWIRQWGYWSPLSNFVRLVEEVGELGRALNHAYGDKPPKPGEERAEAIAEELGDLLFSLLTIANQTEVRLTEALEASMRKYGARDQRRFERAEERRDEG